MQIRRSTAFEKAYKERIRKNPAIRTLFWEALEVFETDPYHPSLRTHPLTGPLEGQYAFSVDYDCRVVFSFTNENLVTLRDIGSHDEVY